MVTRSMWRSLAIVAVLAACRKDAPPPVDCTHAGDGAAAFWAKQLASADRDATRGYAQNMLEIAPARLVRHCKADGWSAAVVECAKTDTDRCIALLTPEQQEQLRTDAEAQMITKAEPIQLLAPSAPGAPCELDPVAITVVAEGAWIGAKGSVPCLRRRVNGDRSAIVSELRRLAQHAAGCNVPIELSAAGTVSYQELTTVMDLAVLSGLSDVRLASPDHAVIAKRPAGDCPLPGGRRDATPSTQVARGSASLASAPVVIVTTDAVLLGGKTIAPLTDVSVGGPTLTALERALPAHPSDGTIVVQADKSIDSVVVLRIVETLQHAGYDNVLFAVKQQER